MAQVVVTVKLMPDSPEIDLKKAAEEAKKKIIAFAGKGDMRVTEEPIAFGLKALLIIFIMDEKLGSTEKVEKELATIHGINSVEITDVRRAIG
jgi:elongation factor 1-beta